MFNLVTLLVRSSANATPALSNGLGWTCLGIAGAHFAHEVLAIHAAAYAVILGYTLEAFLEFRRHRNRTAAARRSPKADRKPCDSEGP